ncbi:MAG: NAD+ synthase [candidate division KSB1 bacterium]|nr:NAD+ synthase [candidate division KSB1 bacterium]
MNSGLLRLALAQINVTVGDLEGNSARIRQALTRARALGADLVAFPELAVTGYPPEDLLLRRSFVDSSRRMIEDLASYTTGLVAIIGFPEAREDGLHNAAAVLFNGQWVTTYRKVHLPNYGVFDEARYFRPGHEALVIEFGGVTIGLSICEDIWLPDVAAVQALRGGAELLLNISASPYHAGKRTVRQEILVSRARENRAWVALVNLVGGQDELVFDGSSAICDPAGTIHAQARPFEEDLLVADIDTTHVQDARRADREFKARSEAFQSDLALRVTKLGELEPGASKPLLEPRGLPSVLASEEEIYLALVTGVRDYVHKNGFTKVVIGLSGGIDSALTATIAADALGAENVIGVTMPSQYSSKGSVTDSQALARNLGIRFLRIPIRRIYRAYATELGPHFHGLAPDVTEENLQARIRANLLMALSNKFGWLVLSTGNKSEVSVGYCTIYGDMVGGYAVLKDVPKTLVYRLARWRNQKAGYALIPENILSKAPSAELRPNQTDQDTLPPYEILDAIVEAYVEKDMGYREIVELGYDPDVVRDVLRRIDLAEYKRRQGPPGVKITPRAFGKDRRMPITNRYREA